MPLAKTQNEFEIPATSIAGIILFRLATRRCQQQFPFLPACSSFHSLNLFLECYKKVLILQCYTLQQLTNTQKVAQNHHI